MPFEEPGLHFGASLLISDFMAVKRGESVLISIDTATDRSMVSAVFNAVLLAGGKPVVVEMAQLPYQGALADPWIPSTVVAATRDCDVWLDFTWPYLAGSHAHDEAMKLERCRYLLLGDIGAGGVARIFGMADLDQCFELLQAFNEVVGAAVGKPVRITTRKGTDVTYELAKPGIAKPRRCTEPGLYVVPGGGSIFPVPETVKGKIVFNTVVHEYFATDAEPFTVLVDGKLTSVDGDRGDLRVMERALRRAGGGDDYGYVIHFTHGMHPTARTTGVSFIEDIRANGNNAVGLGLPWWVPGGGENHPDGICAQHSVWLDGQPFIENGLIVAPSPLAELASRIGPLIR